MQDWGGAATERGFRIRREDLPPEHEKQFGLFGNSR